MTADLVAALAAAKASSTTALPVPAHEQWAQDEEALVERVAEALWDATTVGPLDANLSWSTQVVTGYPHTCDLYRRMAAAAVTAVATFEGGTP
jgi:hypothetical protein